MSHRVSDFLIVGGGAIGLSIAWQLSRQGGSVTVLDSGEPGQASFAAAGMLAPLAEASAPGPFLDLALESLRDYPHIVNLHKEESGLELEISGPGMLRVARTDDEETALCQASQWQSRLGLPLYRLSGNEVRRLESDAAPDIQSAIFSPAERHIEPRRLLAVLSTACVRRGVQFRTEQATGLKMAGSRVSAVETATASYSCGTMVIAGGAWSRALGQLLGLNLPITPLRGQMIAFGPPQPTLLRHTLYTHGSYLVPRPDGRLIAGATEEWAGFAAETTESGINGLKAEAVRLLPRLADWPSHSQWAGLRPVSADGLPILGSAPGWGNVHIATGHGRNGILLTPISGSLMADALLNNIALPVAFDPARFGGVS